MERVLCALVLSCVGSVYAANGEYETKDVLYRHHLIYEENVKAIELTLEITVETDGCNRYFIAGELAPIVGSATWHRHLPFYGDLGVASTEIACEGSVRPVIKTLSKSFTIPAGNDGNIGLDLILDSNYKLSYKAR